MLCIVEMHEEDGKPFPGRLYGPFASTAEVNDWIKNLSQQYKADVISFTVIKCMSPLFAIEESNIQVQPEPEVNPNNDDVYTIPGLVDQIRNGPKRRKIIVRKRKKPNK